MSEQDEGRPQRPRKQSFTKALIEQPPVNTTSSWSSYVVREKMRAEAIHIGPIRVDEPTTDEELVEGTWTEDRRTREMVREGDGRRVPTDQFTDAMKRLLRKRTLSARPGYPDPWDEFNKQVLSSPY